jgi:type IV secretory pathway TrbL component
MEVKLRSREVYPIANLASARDAFSHDAKYSMMDSYNRVAENNDTKPSGLAVAQEWHRAAQRSQTAEHSNQHAAHDLCRAHAEGGKPRYSTLLVQVK